MDNKTNGGSDKSRFETPYAEVRRFSVRDVIRTSPVYMPDDPNYEEDEDL